MDGLERTSKGAQGRKLVLGFDAGCLTCSDLARRIEEEVGDDLEVRSLHDPQVDHWREQALGQNAQWAPTLIEVNGGKVSAWTGMRMGIALARRLGPAATWRVMQALGEVRGAAQPASPAAQAAVTMSRGRFLKGVGGTAVALGVLTGSGGLAPAALAREASEDRAAEALRSVGKTDLTGEELARVLRRTSLRRDVTNVMGESWSARVRGGRMAANEEGDLAVELSDGLHPQTSGRKTSEAGHVTVKAARHKLRNGATMLAVGYKLPREDKVLLYYEFDRPVPNGIDEFESQALLYRAEKDEAVLEHLSIDGKDEVYEDAEGLSTRRRCGICRPGDCLRTVRVCVSIKYGCLAVACAACIPACASILGCLYCAGVQCPYAYNFGCCRRRRNRCAGCNVC